MEATSSAAVRERRVEQRHVLAGQVRYKHASMKWAEGIDLSESGVCIATMEPIAPGTDVPLYLLNGNVEVMATVRNTEPMPGGRHRIGLGFRKAQPDLVQALVIAQGHRQD